MATAQKERTATATSKSKQHSKRTHIGSMQLEQDQASRSLGNFIPERWRDLVAVALLFVSLLVFFRGVLDSNHTFLAGDNVASDSFKPFLEDAAKQGYSMPQWIPNIFCGMPAFAALVTTGERTYDIIHELFDVIQSIPRALSPNHDAMTHIWHYFLFGLGIYLLLRVTRNTSRLVALFGAFSAIFSTWIITYVMIGHNTKIFAIMTMPYILMGIEKLRTPKMRWQSVVFWCAVLATSFHFLLESTHAQMIFYVFLAVLLYYVVSLITELFRKHNVVPLVRSGVLALVMVGLAFAMSADRYMATLAYEPYSIRGVPPIQDTRNPQTQNAANANHATDASGGLDWNYATAWSFSPQEMITFLIPAYYGFGKLPYSGPEVQSEQRISTYWGQMNGTDAANYTGIVVFFLAIVGIFTLWKRDRLVAPLTIISLFALLLSFGGNWPVLFGPMFHVFPMFNKFRAPMMALVLMQVCFPILAALTFEEILRVWNLRNTAEDQRLQKAFRFAMYAGGLFLVIAIIGRGAITGAVTSGINSTRLSGYPEGIKDFIASTAANDALVCAIFATAACALAFFFLRHKISPLVLGAGLLLLTVIDLWRVDVRPLEITSVDEYQQNFQQHDYVQFIKNDKSLYRIMDLNEPTSNVPVSWGTQTIAGYHAAKMREFQDVVDVTGNMNGNGIYNPFMYNLLNTKYIIANGGISEDPNRFVPVFQSKEPTASENGKPGQPTIVWLNPQALPRAFFVNRFEVKPKLDILHAMHDGTFNPRDVVYFEQAPQGLSISATPVDTVGETAFMTSYKNEEIDIHTKTHGDRLLFLSDTWYPDWTATVDGKETPIYKADYAFRAIKVPQGDHQVKFTYYDPKYETGRSVSLMTNALTLIGLAIGVSTIYFVRRKKPEVEVLPEEEVKA